MSGNKKPFDYLAAVSSNLEAVGLKEKEKTKTSKTPLDELEETVLSNSKEDINFSTKIKTLNEKLGILKKQKSEGKDKIEKTKVQEEINSINREKNRLIRFNSVSKSKISGIENLEKEDVDNIGAKKLLQIERSKKGFLSSAFSYKQTQDKEGNIIEEPITNGENIKEGDKIIIDFGKNKSAYWKVGAGDILPINIKVAKITDNNGITRIGLRGIQGSKVGYYDEKGYIPVYNNSMIEIPKKDDEKKILSGIDKTKLEITDGDENITKDKYISEIDRDEERESKVRALNIEANKDFIKSATEISKEIEKSYGIPWQVTFGQATLESGFGNSGLAKKGNYFGIKGKGASFTTKEYYNGKETTIQDSFRVYSDMKESFLDYARLLTQKPLYRNAFKYASNINPRPEYYPKDYNPSDYNPEKFLDTVIKDGYATDPRYVAKVASLWKNQGIDANQMA